jgi:integrase
MTTLFLVNSARPQAQPGHWRFLDSDGEPRRSGDWVERDRALILTALLAGLHTDELLHTNVGDVRRSHDGAVIHVRGKGKDRRIPIESPLVEVLQNYLDSRADRLPVTAKRRYSPAGDGPRGRPRRR